MRFAFLKTNLCALLLFSFSIAAMAQTYTDVVHLKNGTIVKGIIIEQVPGKTIKVQTADALKVEINYSDIEKISKESSITSKDAAITPGTTYNPTTTPVSPQTGFKKYFFTAGAGFFSGDAIGYTGRVSAGLRLDKYFDLQAYFQIIGADEDLARNASKERYSRLSLRNYGIKGSYTLPSKSAVHPYFSIGTGYSKSPYTHSGMAHEIAAGSSGGWYGYYSSYFINPAFGIGIPIGKNNTFFTELNYHYHSWKDMHLSNGNPPENYPKPYKSARFASLLVGVKF